MNVPFDVRRHAAHAVCGQFVASAPSHACLATRAFDLLHQAELLLCVSTSESLAAALDAGSHMGRAAEGLSAKQHCTAVVWALQVGVGMRMCR